MHPMVLMKKSHLTQYVNSVEVKKSLLACERLKAVLMVVWEKFRGGKGQSMSRNLPCAPSPLTHTYGALSLLPFLPSWQRGVPTPTPSSFLKVASARETTTKPRAGWRNSWVSSSVFRCIGEGASEQRSSTFLAPEASFTENNFPTDQGGRGLILGWFKWIPFIEHSISNLMAPLVRGLEVEFLREFWIWIYPPTIIPLLGKHPRHWLLCMTVVHRVPALSLPPLSSLWLSPDFCPWWTTGLNELLKNMAHSFPLLRPFMWFWWGEWKLC